MKRFTPAFLAAITIGSKASRLIDGRELLVELEAGVVRDAGEVDDRVDALERLRQLGVSRMSPWMTLRFGLSFGRNSSPKYMMS